MYTRYMDIYTVYQKNGYTYMYLFFFVQVSCVMETDWSRLCLAKNGLTGNPFAGPFRIKLSQRERWEMCSHLKSSRFGCPFKQYFWIQRRGFVEPREMCGTGSSPI